MRPGQRLTLTSLSDLPELSKVMCNSVVLSSAWISRGTLTHLICNDTDQGRVGHNANPRLPLLNRFPIQIPLMLPLFLHLVSRDDSSPLKFFRKYVTYCA